MTAIQVFVLDAFAVLSYFRDEPGAGQVERLLIDAELGSISLHLATVNLAETLYWMKRRSGGDAAATVLAVLDRLPIRLVDCDRALSVRAAGHKADHPVSLADCYVVALAEFLGATVVTGDPDFRLFEHLVAVEWLER